jgi:hypothetical protein
MTDEQQIRKDLEGSRHGLIEVLFHHLSGRTEEHHEIPVRIAGALTEILTENL